MARRTQSARQTQSAWQTQSAQMRRRWILLVPALLVAVALSSSRLDSYPIDAYRWTGIARLEHARLAQLGELRGRQLPEGAKLGAAEITLAQPKVFRDAAGQLSLPPIDAELSQQLRALLAPEDRERYGIAVLDYSDPENPVYAEHHGNYRSNVGSVGKVLAGVAVLQQLADLYPNDIAARERILRDTRVVANDYVMYDSHRVPIFDVDQRELQYRPLRPGDEGSLWEFLDWMFSASSNGAASIVIQQATLLRHFGHQYPRSQEEHERWLAEADRKAEGEVMLAALMRGLEANGLDPENLRQGSPFTGNAKRATAGQTSYGTPRELVRLLYALETGHLIDEWSSLELKRLLYMTQRRIRYASHPALHDAAVYFKSGSLYSCQEEEGFVCEKYKGNRINILASVALVESPAVSSHHKYAVAVISNVLYKNSAVAHQTLAMRIHRLLEKRHPVSNPAPNETAGDTGDVTDSDTVTETAVHSVDPSL